MLPKSKGWESSPLPGLLHPRLKNFTVQVLAGVLPPSRRARGPSPLRPPSSLLEAPSPGPHSLHLQGGLEKWNDNYCLLHHYNWLSRTTRQPRKRPSTPKPKGCSTITNFIKIHEFQCLCKQYYLKRYICILFTVNKHIACSKCEQVSTHCTLIPEARCSFHSCVLLCVSMRFQLDNWTLLWAERNKAWAFLTISFSHVALLPLRVAVNCLFLLRSWDKTYVFPGKKI